MLKLWRRFGILGPRSVKANNLQDETTYSVVPREFVCWVKIRRIQTRQNVQVHFFTRNLGDRSPSHMLFDMSVRGSEVEFKKAL